MRRSRRSFIPNPHLILAIPEISRICPSPSQYLCGSDASNGLQGLAGWYLGGLPIPWSGPCVSRHGTQAPLPADAPVNCPRSVCPSFRRFPPPLSPVPSIASLAAANPSRWCSPNSVSGPSTHSLGPTCRSAAAPARPTKVTGVVFHTRPWICPRSGRSQGERHDFRGESGSSCKQPIRSMLGCIDRRARSAGRARIGRGSPGAAAPHLRVWEIRTEQSEGHQQLRSNNTVAPARPMSDTRPVGDFPETGNTPASCRSTVHAKGASSRK